MATFDKKAPGVYVEEISKLPPSVASVATAIPGFVGYTGKGVKNTAIRVESLLDFEEKFGYACKVTIEPKEMNENGESQYDINGLQYKLHESMRLFYANGGGICYVVSVGGYTDEITNKALEDGIAMLEPIDEVTMIAVPDAVSLDIAKMASVQNAALAQCVELKDRVAILDVKDTGNCNDDAANFRSKIGTNGASYGAAYYPYIKSVYDREVNVYDIYKGLNLTEEEAKKANKYAELSEPTEDSILFGKQLMAKPEYAQLVAKIQEQACVLPPSAAIAGIYCANDSQRGVWQAPANMSVNGISDINMRISEKQQGALNEDTSGKCINAIRAFQGKGILVWGARTLDGLSSEWKYISVRRLFNYIEESIQESTAWAVFQPNDANTWVKVRCQIENFLSNLWRDGALAGSTTQDAFYVRVGLNQTMTAQDILNGYMIVEIGLAAVRPAEFIVLQFSHKLQES